MEWILYLVIGAVVLVAVLAARTAAQAAEQLRPITATELAELEAALRRYNQFIPASMARRAWLAAHTCRLYLDGA